MSVKSMLPTCLVLSTVVVVSEGTSCLPDAIAADQRKNLTFGLSDGSQIDLPLGVWYIGWTSGDMMCEMLNIVASEVLGVQTKSIRGGSSSLQAAYALNGCETPLDAVDKGCPSTEPPYTEVHASLELWSYHSYQLLIEQENSWSKAEALGGVGYKGKELLFVLSQNREAALYDAGLALEFYRSYNTSWNSPWNYYLSTTQVPHSLLMPCDQTRVYDPSHSANYLKVTGDAEGVEIASDGTVNGKCTNGTWWVAPGCRDDHSHCIPVVTGGTGWGLDMMMQQAATYNMPVAFATAASWGDYLAVPRANSTLLYWWTPDAAFADLTPMEVTFPLHDPLAYAAGDKRTAMEPSQLEKVVSKDLAAASPLVYEFIQNMNVPEGIINDLVKQAASEQHRTNEELICEWMKGNQNVWRAWVPEKTKCVAGQGLVDLQGAFVSNRSTAVDCEWCAAGRASLEYEDVTGPTFTCEMCPEGQNQESPGQRTCEDCKPGRFSPVKGNAQCAECEAGSATGLPGQIECPLCTPGYIASMPGQLICSPCAAGTVASKEGSTGCAFCDRGSFQNSTGAAACIDCNDIVLGSSSQRGSTDSAECACSENFFMRPSEGCTECLVGLVCPGGNEPPLQQEGFWSDIVNEAERTYSVYKCRNVFECKTGPLGSCAEGRGGTACNNCLDNHYPSDNGECSQCGGANVIPFVGLAVLLPLGVVAFALLLRMDASKQQLSTLTIGMTAGQLMTAIQALGAMQQLRISYPEPLKSIMGIMSIFTLDLDLLQLPCLFSQDSPVTKFALKLLAYPFFLATLFAVYFGMKALRRPLDVDNLFNLNGMILFVMFISLTLAVLLPFQCQWNPNQTLSMATNPGLVCLDSPDHIALLVLAVIGTLVYPLAILSWAIWATLQFRARANSADGVALLRRYRFLFGRYKPDRYYFGVFFLFRNGCVAAIPILLVRMPALQTMAIGIVLLVGFCFQCRLWPWRTLSANLSDLFIGFLLLLLIIGVSPMLDVDKDSAGRLLGGLLTFIVISVLICSIGALGFAVYRRFVPANVFGMFLCHHKAGAGALARQMKMSLKGKMSSPVFLDSDQLEDLDLIFDTVRSRTSNLVILLSPEVLTRMWCAGEIVTAHRNKIPIVPVVLDGYHAPDEDRIQAIPKSWTEEQISTLLSFDITTDMVEDAYRYVVSLPTIVMKRQEDLDQKEIMISDIVTACKLSKMAGFGNSKKSSVGNAKRVPEVVISGAVMDVEALAACEICQQLLQQELQVEAEVVRTATRGAEVTSARVFLVLLSKGLLEDLAFAKLLLTMLDPAEGDPPEIVTVSADTNFQFPAGDFYTKLEREGLNAPELGPEEGPRLSAAYRSLLSILALPFSPLGSEGLIEKQISEVCRRASKLLQTKSSRKSMRGSNSFKTSTNSASILQTSAEKEDGSQPAPPFVEVAATELNEEELVVAEDF